MENNNESGSPTDGENNNTNLGNTENGNVENTSTESTSTETVQSGETTGSTETNTDNTASEGNVTSETAASGSGTTSEVTMFTATDGDNITIVFDGDASKTVIVPKGSTVKKALEAAKIGVTTHSYRSSNGSHLGATDVLNDNMTVSVVKKVRQG